MKKVFFMFLLPAVLTAEVVQFKNGEIMEGKLVRETKQYIILKSKQEDFVFSKEAVKGVYSGRKARDLLQKEKIKKREEKKKKAKERAKKEIRKEIRDQVRKSLGRSKWSLPSSSGWVFGRSVIFPGWGQAEAGMSAGYISAGITSVAAVVYLDQQAKRANENYQDRVIENTAITLLPGPAGVPERIVTGFVLNELAGNSCAVANNNLNVSQQLLGGLYIAQLIQIATQLWIPVAANDHNFKTDFGIYTFNRSGRPESGAFFRLTLSTDWQPR